MVTRASLAGVMYNVKRNIGIFRVDGPTTVVFWHISSVLPKRAIEVMVESHFSPEHGSPAAN